MRTVDQPAPSSPRRTERYVFATLEPMALSQQHVTVDAVMNSRKRGLRFFSGFDPGA